MAGYSGTALEKKLGVRSGSVVALMNAPRGFELLIADADAKVNRGFGGKAPCDVIVLFCGRRVDLERGFGKARERLDEAGGLWVAWPKRASGVETDLTEQEVREFGLATGMVDNKVCAIDATWSGLRLVIRKENRT